ncbi:MAG: NAD-dependent epimerase/dehydratase family protein [Fimbriimonadaceae bacterium]|nr:NAD-dependent epimerase/dehydratase family protein [Fimbriimonadaceae bacterium]
MRVLVTGGAGFIGSHLVDRLLDGGDRVCVYDDFSTGSRTNLRSAAELEVVEGDIRDENRFAATVGDFAPEAVIHLAANASVSQSCEDPLLTHSVNSRGTLVVLESCRRAGVRRLLYASSAAVYGQATKLPIAEEDPKTPESPYAIDKLAGEMYLRFVVDQTPGSAGVAMRFFNVYGPRQHPDSPYSGVISRFAERVAAGRPLRIDGDGHQTRDFVYVGDLVRRIEGYLRDKAFGFEVANLGTGVPTSILDLVRGFAVAAGRTPEVQHGPPRVGDVRHSCADAGRAMASGWRAEVPLAEGLSRVLSWQRAQG